MKRGRSNENIYLASNELPSHPHKVAGLNSDFAQGRALAVPSASMYMKNSEEEVLDLERHRERLRSSASSENRSAPMYSAHPFASGATAVGKNHTVGNMSIRSQDHVGLDSVPPTFNSLHSQDQTQHTRMVITPNPNSTLQHRREAGAPPPSWTAPSIELSAQAGRQSSSSGVFQFPTSHGELATRPPASGSSHVGAGQETYPAGGPGLRAPPGSALQEALLNLKRTHELKSQVKLKEDEQRLDLDPNAAQLESRVHTSRSGSSGTNGANVYPFPAATVTHATFPGGFPPPSSGFHDSHTLVSQIGVYSNQNVQPSSAEPPPTSALPSPHEFTAPSAPGASLLADAAASSSRVSVHLKGLPNNLNFDQDLPPLVFTELINFGRTKNRSERRHCVMCGQTAGVECTIPTQNKDVCNVCDTGIWMLQAKRVHFKWCKGCKRFLHLRAFAQKLGAVSKSKHSAKRPGPPKQPTKCDVCRGRGRDAYRAKRNAALTEAASKSPSAPLDEAT